MKLWFFMFALLVGNQVSAQVLATVGSEKITTEEFNRKLEDVRKQAMNPPTPDQFLEDLVRFSVGVQEADKTKLANDPLVKERIRQVLYNALLEKALGKEIEDIKISDADLKQYYKKSPEVRLAHILIEVKPEATADEREIVHKRALEILDDVKKSKRPFEELVRLYTDDIPTKEVGGDIGYQSRVTLVPAIYESALKLKVGEIKGLIETRYGFHIIKLLDQRAFDLADKRQIRAAIFDDRRAKLFNDYFDKLKKQYKIEVNHAALKAQKH